MQSSFWKTVKVIRLLLLALALLCFGNLLTGQNPQSERKEENLTPAQRKIAVVLRNIGRELAAAGVNSSNAQARNAARQYSTRLVRIDNKARVQVYIDLTEVNAGRLQALAAISDIEIEITDEKSKRIQAWVSNRQ